MNKSMAMAAVAAAAMVATGAELAQDAPPVDLGDASGFTVRVGAGYRGGMKVKAHGAGSHSAVEGARLFNARRGKAPGNVNATPTSTSSTSFGYTDGERDFNWVENGVTDPTWLGTGTIHADGTYAGGDYSPVYDDVYFSDYRKTTTTVGAGSVSQGSLDIQGGLSSDDGDMNGWGTVVDFEFALPDMGAGVSAAAFLGIRSYWDLEETLNGSGLRMAWDGTTTTYAGRTRTETTFYDVTAPLTLSGTLDFPNATVFSGSSVAYGPDGGSSTRKVRRVASAVSKIDVEADLYQLAAGASFGVEKGLWSFQVRPALHLNCIDADIERTEMLALSNGEVVGSWRDNGDDSKWRVGAGVDVVAAYDIGRGWGAWVSGGYEWVDKAKFDVGPQSVEIDASAWTLAVGAGKNF